MRKSEAQENSPDTCLRRRRPFLHLRNVADLRHRYWRADTRKAERDFGYISRHRLADGLALTARWYSDQHLIGTP